MPQTWSTTPEGNRCGLKQTDSPPIGLVDTTKWFCGKKKKKNHFIYKIQNSSLNLLLYYLLPAYLTTENYYRLVLATLMKPMHQ